MKTEGAHNLAANLWQSEAVSATVAGTWSSVAAYEDQREVTEPLLAAGATPSLRDDAGKTAADYAREQGHDDLAAWLEEQAALVED